MIKEYIVIGYVIMIRVVIDVLYQCGGNVYWGEVVEFKIKWEYICVELLMDYILILIEGILVFEQRIFIYVCDIYILFQIFLVVNDRN